jgi:hypothetical protein
VTDRPDDAPANDTGPDETGPDETGPDETGPNDTRPNDSDEADELETYDSGEPDYGANSTALPPRVEAWRKRSATGAILTGLALGLQNALEAKREDPSIVMETSGDPPQDLPVEADFEYRRPKHSVVNIRPWLLDPKADGEAAEDHTDPDPEPDTDNPGPSATR